MSPCRCLGDCHRYVWVQAKCFLASLVPGLGQAPPVCRNREDKPDALQELLRYSSDKAYGKKGVALGRARCARCRCWIGPCPASVVGRGVACLCSVLWASPGRWCEDAHPAWLCIAHASGRVWGKALMCSYFRSQQGHPECEPSVGARALLPTWGQGTGLVVHRPPGRCPRTALLTWPPCLLPPMAGRFPWIIECQGRRRAGRFTLA